MPKDIILQNTTCLHFMQHLYVLSYIIMGKPDSHISFFNDLSCFVRRRELYHQKISMIIVAVAGRMNHCNYA
jgi:hypothetical protein